MQLSDLIQRRFWLKDPTNDRVLSGWVIELSGKSIILEMGEVMFVNPGEQYLCAVHYAAGQALFACNLENVDGRNLKATPTTALTFRESDSDPRKRVLRQETLIYEGEKLLVQVIDISATGIGVLTPMELKPGTYFDFEFTTDTGEITVSGKVTYSRQDQATGQYKSGIVLNMSDRVHQARWMVFVQEGDTILSHYVRPASKPA